jgi:hypothetical protein
MNPFRSLVAVIAGVGVISVVVQLLEFTLVNAAAPTPISDIAGYFAVRNQPLILAAKLVYNTLAAILGGYVTAKVARTAEVRHGMVAAAAQTAAFAWWFTLGEFASFTPVWMRIVLVLLTGPAMIAGATIRARAVSLRKVDS